MNSILQHLPVENVLRAVGDCASCDDQPGCSNDQLTLRDENTILGRAIPDPHHSIAGIFRNRSVNKVSGHAKRLENIAVFHSHSPSRFSDEHHHLITSVGNRTDYFVINRNKRFRAAPCPVLGRTLLNVTTHLTIENVEMSA